ncbi:MAG: flavin reductase family protein [Armatimonadetes bacterium]|nr:flavin reductase family protein [Armatimonadota bacterium]
MAEKASRPPAPDESGLFLPEATILIAFTNGEGESLLLPTSDHAYYGRYPTIVGFSVARRFLDLYRGIHEAISFTMNVPDTRHEAAVRLCQREAGRRDLMRLAGFTPSPGLAVRAPIVEECIVNLECELRHSIALGEYDFILGEVLMTHTDPVFNAENHNIRWASYMGWEEG